MWFYDADFLKNLKKTDVRIRKKFKEQILIFSDNPNYPTLHNHKLRDKYAGYRSIDIDSVWRALYEEVQIEHETVAYFIELGTHDQLYRKSTVG